MAVVQFVTALGRCGTQLPVDGFCVVLQGVAAADPCRFGTLVRAILTASYAALVFTSFRY